MQWLIFGIVQIVVLISVYSYFRWKQKQEMGRTKRAVVKDDTKELSELRLMRARSLSVPLSEKSRPMTMADVVGQENGIKALRAALCGPNPQHVIIYGPPGVGKTCAARLVLDEAKKRKDSPFDMSSKFVEIDATCIRFDERSIADPLIGSVHDPIYQGAGALGVAGVPQPKPGAVTKAHCGVLFLDEIGELHPMQMNKLLKVLEDRRVYFESAYYSKNNNSIPMHIHDIFQNGLPADFRLIGATTRSPEELPPALRSRCVEIFFSPLSDTDLVSIAKRAAERVDIGLAGKALIDCAEYSYSGRDIVNIVQLAGSVAHDEGRTFITDKDVEWVADTCRHIRKHRAKIGGKARIGAANGLGVSGSTGAVIEIECSVRKATQAGAGTVTVRGAVEEEELKVAGRSLKRKSMAKSSAENVIDAFLKVFDIDCKKYDIAFNIPGGMPMDGPSAGIALAIALMSALTGKKPKPSLALTGEVTSNGEVRPIGGVREKLEAARLSGATEVIIPTENMEQAISVPNMKITTVSTLAEVVKAAFEARVAATANTEQKGTQVSA